MNLIYDIIEQPNLKDTSKEFIKELATFLFETRQKNLSGKVIAGENRTLDQYILEIQSLCKMSNFLMCVYDEGKCIAFRFIIPAKFSKYIQLSSVSDKIKHQKIKDWWISQDLNIEEGYIGHYALHKDYHGQGIMTELRNRCNEEAKKRGFKWVTGYGFQEKSLYDYTMRYYKKQGYTPVFSDINSPTGYGKIYYYYI